LTPLDLLDADDIGEANSMQRGTAGAIPAIGVDRNHSCVSVEFYCS
jgi:hypothetical protein